LNTNNLILESVRKYWDEFSSEECLGDNHNILDDDLPHLKFFQIGETFFVIYNFHKSEYDFVSPEMTAILGYDEKNFNVEKLISIIHPDDIIQFIDCQKTIADFNSKISPDKIVKYKVHFNFRLKKSNGDYLSFLVQSFVIQSNVEGRIVKNLAIYTDVTNFNFHNKIALSFVGMEGEPSYLDVPLLKNEFVQTKLLFTKRELTILKLVAIGKNSQEIADLLFISRLTVDTHRKNILKKAECKSTNELLVNVVKHGWI
jgi:DNA-binding CsgD family transcriptional regulator